MNLGEATISIGVDTAPVLSGLNSLKQDIGKLGKDTGDQYSKTLEEGLGTIATDLELDIDGVLEKIRTQGSEVFDGLGDAALSTLGHMMDAFEEFARTGELNVREMVNAILRDLARIALEKLLEETSDAILSTVISIGSSLVSAFAGAPAVAPGKALGGSVSSGRPYVVGEQGRELFVPETSGRIVPNQGFGTTNITFNVQATDALSFQRSESQIAAMLNRLVMRGGRNL